MSAKFSRFSVFSIFLAELSACANPTTAIRTDIDRFKREHADRIVRFEGTKKMLRYAWSGDPTKRPLLFVHGSPGSWEGWSHFLLDETLARNFQIIAVDRLGYGGSDPGKSEPSLHEQSDAVLEALKFNRSGLPAILVGHSFGGPVIARAAMDHPDRVAALVFVASSVDPNLERVKWFQYPAKWWPIRLMIPDALRVCNEEILTLKNELREMLPKWTNIRAKSILIQGEKDDLVPPENVDFLLNHLDKKNVLKVIRVPGLNHFVPWKRPDLIFDVVYDLEKVLNETSPDQNQTKTRLNAGT